jgi:two-component system, NtrC family, sensor histidine kinase HydH
LKRLIGLNAPTVGGVGPQKNSAQSPGRFALSRWFGLMAFATIAAIAIISVWLLSWFVTQRMLWQDGILTRDFVQGLMLVEKPMQDFMRAPTKALPPAVEASFENILRMPDMVRVNVYGLDRRVIWSSDRSIIGRSFGANKELDEALAGAVVVEKKDTDDLVHGKPEHESLKATNLIFIEIYFPVIDVETKRVTGAIEFYKNPRPLTNVLMQLRSYIALGATLFGLLLFGALFWLVRRADRIMQSQERRLIENETFAVVGEMSSVVAHGIRNPLASIRSSAEIILQSPGENATEAARDIVAQSDRLGSWVNELLAYTKPSDQLAQSVLLGSIVETCLGEFSRDFERGNVQIKVDMPDNLPSVRGDALAIGQVLRTLLANALDAVRVGGLIRVTASADTDQSKVTLKVEDNGIGISLSQRERVGTAFFTTKPQGMGMGLALARRVIERAGGSLQLDSELGKGTVVSVIFMTATA